MTAKGYGPYFYLFEPQSFQNGEYEVKFECYECFTSLQDVADCWHITIKVISLSKNKFQTLSVSIGKENTRVSKKYRNTFIFILNGLKNISILPPPNLL